MSIYNYIGQDYDTTRRADPYITSRLARWVDIRPGHKYLDVACGTGNYTVALAGYGGSWHGADQSQHMITAARAKTKAIGWQMADAAALPYGNATFCGAVCTLAIHHFPELLPAFREVHRVLQGGRFVLFTATPEQIKGYWLNRYFPDAMRKAVAQMPSLDLVVDTLCNAGFVSIDTEPYQVSKDLQDFFLYSGKHRPDLYLDAQIRAGISMFSTLAEETEVELGCRRLAEDIQTGRIHEIMKQYKNDSDYLFIAASR